MYSLINSFYAQLSYLYLQALWLASDIPFCNLLILTRSTFSTIFSSDIPDLFTSHLSFHFTNPKSFF